MTDKWTDRLSAYLDGELDSVDRAALEAHLEQCDECRDALKQLNGVVGWAQAYRANQSATCGPRSLTNYGNRRARS